MKFFSYLTLIIFLISCGNSKKLKNNAHEIPEEDNILVDSFQYKLLISENKLDTSVLKIHYQYFKKIKFPWQDSVNKQIAKITMDKTNYSKSDEIAMQVNDAFFKNQLEEVYKEAILDYKKAIFKYLWEFEMEISIDVSYKNFASLQVKSSVYSGKIKTNQRNEFFHFSTNTGSKLNVSDFYNLESITNFSESYFKQNQNIAPFVNYSDLGYWFENNQFKLTDNFYFDQDKLVFYYNTYEIAPYSFGNIFFSVPLNSTKTYLKIDLSKN